MVNTPGVEFYSNSEHLRIDNIKRRETVLS
jgi:hypothetical protein